jgi:hypothetical protein
MDRHYLNLICSIKPNDSKEIQDQKQETRFKLSYTQDIVMLDLKITLVPKLFGQSVRGYCLIERPKRSRFLNKKTKDTLDVNFFEDENPTNNKYLVEYSISRNTLGSLKVDLQFISGNIFLDSPYPLIKSFFSPEEIKNFDLWAESVFRLIVKLRLYVYNASEPKWDSLNTFSDFFSYTIAQCDLAEGKSCAIKIYEGGSHSYFNYGEIELVYYIKNPQKDQVRDNFKLDQIYEVKKIIRDFGSVTAIPQYRPLPPDELQQLIAKGKFYPYFHDN